MDLWLSKAEKVDRPVILEAYAALLQILRKIKTNDTTTKDDLVSISGV